MTAPTGSADDLIRIMEAEDADHRAGMLDCMNAIMFLNKQLKPLEAAKKEAVDTLKQAIALSGETSFVDYETNVIARLQDRKGTPVYDAKSAAGTDAGRDALHEAALAGMVRIDHVMLARFIKESGGGWADLLNKYQMPGTGTVALIVEEM